MTTSTRPFAVTGAALVAAGALFVATPTIDVNRDVSATGVTSLTTSVQLVSHWEDRDDDDDDDYYVDPGVGVGSVAYDSDDDDDEDDDRGRGRGSWFGGIGNIGSFITDYLDNNQTQVLSVTAMIPVFNLGPVPVGNSLLANAYYDGYNGSAVGVPGVVSYVTSQLGTTPTNILQGVVLGVTSLTPRINIGPVAIGNGLLATAYFSGYNSSATGLPGVVSYVTSQLGIQAAPASAVRAPATSVVAARSGSVAARAASAAPEAADDSSTAGTAKADTASAGRSTAGRLTAKAASAAGQAKAGAARAARASADAS
jgi:hypothetical protein